MALPRYEFIGVINTSVKYTNAEYQRRVQLVHAGEWNDCWLTFPDDRQMFAHTVGHEARGTVLAVGTVDGNPVAWRFDPRAVVRAVH